MANPTERGTDKSTGRASRPGGVLHALAFGRDTKGGVLLAFGLAAPVLFGFAAVSVTYAQLTARRAQLQAAADTAALTAARELTLANAEDDRTLSVAKIAALNALTQDQPLGTSATPEPRLLGEKGQRSGVGITITETVTNPLGKLLSRPSTTLIVKASARLSGTGKVCLIGLDEKLKGTVHLKSRAQITAEGCGLYSNSKDTEGLRSDDNAQVVAALVCSAGGFREGKKGVSFRPAPTTDCPVMSDPLVTRPAPYVSAECSHVKEVRGDGKVKAVSAPAPADGKAKKDGRDAAQQTSPPAPGPDPAPADPAGVVTDAGGGVELAPGTYCAGLKVHGGAKVTLKAGVYVMQGPLVVDGASLSGENVGLYFKGDRASLLFDHDSSISLTAPRDGDMAGLLMFEQRAVGAPDQAPGGKAKGKAPPPPPGAPPLREYRIISDDAQTLLGTIYLPSGRLIIDSKKPVAGQSAYTVVVARRIELSDGPNLVLNTDYGATNIPVPKGVGPVGREVSLAD